MFIIENGRYVIGYTKTQKCDHCNNVEKWPILMVFVKQKSLGFITTMNQESAVSIICPVCEQGDEYPILPLLRPNLTQESKNFVGNSLRENADFNINNFYLTLSPKSRKRVRKAWDKIGATDLITQTV